MATKFFLIDINTLPLVTRQKEGIRMATHFEMLAKVKITQTKKHKLYGPQRIEYSRLGHLPIPQLLLVD